MVIPGFGAGDKSTAVLRSYLRWLGYAPMGWGLGRNLGARTIGQHNEVLVERLGQLHRQLGEKITLIGWSMGGIIARMVARERMEAVARIVLLAAPITGNPYSNRGWSAYERMSGHSLAHPVARAQIRQSKLPMPVPSTSLYSKSDGVVHWECCLEPATRHSRNIEVRSSHCGFAFSPPVLRTIADCLAQPY